MPTKTLDPAVQQPFQGHQKAENPDFPGFLGKGQEGNSQNSSSSLAKRQPQVSKINIEDYFF